MLVNPQKKASVCDTVISIRIPKVDAVLLETLVEAAKAQGLATSKASFIRYVLNEYATSQAEVSL